MSRAFQRRTKRMLDTTNAHLAQSKWIIWCFQPEHMPAMIDLLIAQGRLSEADRAHCVHWRKVEGPARPTREGIVKLVDADEMLQKAGIRTLIAQGSAAIMQGPEAFGAFWRRHCGEPDAEVRRALEPLRRSAQDWQDRARAAASTDPDGCISACK